MSFSSFFKKIFKRKKEVPKLKIGLALSGGGARGFGHLGALKAFEENGIKFDAIAGTSVGSLVGALWAYGYTAEQIIEIGLKLKEKDIRTSKIIFVPSKTDKLQNLVESKLGDIDIKDLKVPFYAVAVDMKSGEEIVFSEGRLKKIIPASCAVPGVFEPVEYEDFLLMDGGLSNVIPADVLKMFGCDIVISVDINKYRGSGTSSKKLLDLVMASIRILMKSNAIKGKVSSDILIEPELKNFKSTKLDGGKDMIEEGYRATIEKMPEIKSLLKLDGDEPKKVKKIKEHKKKYQKNHILDLDEEIEIFDKSLE